MAGHHVAHLFRQHRAEAGRALRIHQHAGALQVAVGVQPGGQDKMPFQQCSGGAEFVQNLVLRHRVYPVLRLTSLTDGLPRSDAMISFRCLRS